MRVLIRATHEASSKDLCLRGLLCDMAVAGAQCH